MTFRRVNIIKIKESVIQTERGRETWQLNAMHGFETRSLIYKGYF